MAPSLARAIGSRANADSVAASFKALDDPFRVRVREESEVRFVVLAMRVDDDDLRRTFCPTPSLSRAGRPVFCCPRPSCGVGRFKGERGEEGVRVDKEANEEEVGDGTLATFRGVLEVSSSPAARPHSSLADVAGPTSRPRTAHWMMRLARCRFRCSSSRSMPSNASADDTSTAAGRVNTPCVLEAKHSMNTCRVMPHSPSSTYTERASVDANMPRRMLRVSWSGV